MSAGECCLPVEIVERLFYFLDGTTVVNASRVCKVWQSIFVRLVERKNLFKIRCFSEIPPQCLTEIVDRLYPFRPLKDSTGIDWNRVYQCWHYGKFTHNYSATMTCVMEEHACQILCMKLSGDWAVYGTANEGKLDMFNMETYSISTFQPYRGHGITDVDLCSWTGTHKELGLHDGVKCFVKQIRKIISLSFQDNERSVLYDGTCDQDQNIRLKWLLSVQTNYCLKIRSFGFEHLNLELNEANNILLNTIREQYYITVNDYSEVKFHPDNEASRNDSDVWFRGFETLGIWLQLSVNVSFGIGFSPLHMIFFAVKSKIKAFLPHSIMGQIRTAFLHCNKLYLGNNTGCIYMYKLKDEDSLLELDLTNFTRKYTIPSNHCIVSIDLQYTEENIEYITIASRTCLWKLEYYK